MLHAASFAQSNSTESVLRLLPSRVSAKLTTPPAIAANKYASNSKVPWGKIPRKPAEIPAANPPVAKYCFAF